MIYEVQKDNITFEIDDTVLLTDQTREFQRIFNENIDKDNVAYFDNATLVLTPYGRILINSID